MYIYIHTYIHIYILILIRVIQDPFLGAIVDIDYFVSQPCWGFSPKAMELSGVWPLRPVQGYLNLLRQVIFQNVRSWPACPNDDLLVVVNFSKGANELESWWYYNCKFVNPVRSKINSHEPYQTWVFCSFWWRNTAGEGQIKVSTTAKATKTHASWGPWFLLLLLPVDERNGPQRPARHGHLFWYFRSPGRAVSMMVFSTFCCHQGKR